MPRTRGVRLDLSASAHLHFASALVSHWTPSQSPPQLPTQDGTQALSNPLPPRSLHLSLLPLGHHQQGTAATTRQSCGSLSLHALSLLFVLTIISVDFFCESGATHKVYPLLCSHLRDRHGLYLTTQTSTGAPCAFKLALLPSWRISPWKFRASFLSYLLRALSCRVVLDHFISHLSPLLQLRRHQ